MEIVPLDLRGDFLCPLRMRMEVEIGLNRRYAVHVALNLGTVKDAGIVGNEQPNVGAAFGRTERKVSEVFNCSGVVNIKACEPESGVTTEAPRRGEPRGRVRRRVRPVT